MKPRIRFETSHEDPQAVARAVSPDNTDEITTRVEDGVVVTTIRRESPGSLRSTADDYVRNVSVADRVLKISIENGK